jgi:hypothetical protein
MEDTGMVCMNCDHHENYVFRVTKLEATVDKHSEKLERIDKTIAKIEGATSFLIWEIPLVVAIGGVIVRMLS